MSFPDRRAQVAKDNARIARAATCLVPENGGVARALPEQRLRPASAPQDRPGQYESSGKPASAPTRVPARSLESVGENSGAFLNLMIQCRCELRNQYGQFVFPFVDEPGQRVRRPLGPVQLQAE